MGYFNTKLVLQRGPCSGLKAIWVGLNWITLRKPGHKAPTYRQLSSNFISKDRVLLPCKCWNYSFADRKSCPAGKRGNYGQSKLGVQQTLYGRQSRLTDGKHAYGRWQWKGR